MNTKPVRRRFSPVEPTPTEVHDKSDSNGLFLAPVENENTSWKVVLHFRFITSWPKTAIQYTIQTTVVFDFTHNQYTSSVVKLKSKNCYLFSFSSSLL